MNPKKQENKIKKPILRYVEPDLPELDGIAPQSDSDIQNSPDWLGGAETENEFWEHTDK